MKNSYLIPGAIILAGIIIAGTFLYAKTPQSANISKSLETDQNNSSEKLDGKIDIAVTDKDHIRGNPNASITIVEFSDFECPFCARFHPTVEEILNNYPDDVRWVYKHFPLDSIHREARPSAEASECAGEQGKFWEFADGLFENQTRLGKDLYGELAQEIGLNMDQFGECISSRKYKDKVESDLQEGIKLGVTGTPGNFINGEPVFGAVPYAQLEEVIKKILNK
ncbi:DsbA family protein [Patescibacteria group bacterium]|nr:DsbA family protein [Patescibacteria group bacterium]